MDKSKLKRKYTTTDVLNHFGISVNRHGFINCINNAHPDKNASCKVYRDNINCFSCAASFDIFQIYRQLSNRHSETFNELIQRFCEDFGETYQCKENHVKTSRSELDRLKDIRFARWRCRTEQRRISEYRKTIYRNIESKQDEWVKACRQNRYVSDWVVNNWEIKREMEEQRNEGRINIY